MDLKERAEALSKELKVNFDKIHLVIGVTSDVLEGAFNGHKKSADAVEKFFTDRQSAFEKYSAEQIEIIRSFERSIPKAGSAGKAAEKIGMNASIISGLRKNNYKGNSDKKFSELASYFKIKDAKEVFA